LSRSIADVFREHGAAAPALARAKASLATEADHRRFLDAARKLLDLDPVFRKRPLKKRTKMLTGPIDTPAAEQRIVAELHDAMARLVQEGLRAPDDPRFYLSATRLLMANLVTKGLASGCTNTPSAQHREVLLDATLFLREAWDDCVAAQRKTRGGLRSNDANKKDSDRAREDWLRTRAREWRERRPDARQSEGWQWLHNQVKKQKEITAWSTQVALRSWANRKGIRI
jgi:hypothetical protein